MGTPGHTTNERRKKLGRRILQTLREKRNDQRFDIKQIIDAPQIFEFSGGAEGGEIDTAMTHISRKNTTDAPKIETELNDEKSVEYSRPNSENCKRKRPDIRSYPNHDAETYRNNETQTLEGGEEGEKATP